MKIIKRLLLILVWVIVVSTSHAQETDLTTGLEHKNWEVRKKTAELIGLQKVESAVKILIETLNDEHPQVRESAYQALINITGEKFPAEYDLWINWWRSHGIKKYGGAPRVAKQLARAQFYLGVGFVIIIISIALLLLFIMVFSFIGGSKIKTIKELIKGAQKYIEEANEATKKSDRVIEELEKRRLEIADYLKHLREENQTEIERFSDLLQENIEHRIREAALALREKAETELKETFTSLRQEFEIQFRQLANSERQKLANEIAAQMLYIDGSLYFINRHYQEAIKIYKKLFALKPDHFFAWKNYGLSLRYLGRYDEALEAFEEALKISPNNSEILYNIAAIYALMHNKPQMLEYLSYAIKFDSNLKDEALNDESFKEYWEDHEFKNLAQI